MTLLSVIIPIFNAESTLPRALSSIEEQQAGGIEVILVNDGSTDSSLSLCEEYAQKTKYKTQIINKDNGGSRDARNAGLEVATGKYITFIDADDYLSAGTYNDNLNILLEQPSIELLEYPLFEYLNDTDYCLHSFHSCVMQNREGVVLEWLSRLGFRSSYSCNKIYKRSIFDNLRFSGGRDFDDFHTMPHIMRRVTHYYGSDKGGYHYVTSKNSLSHCITIQRAERVVQSTNQLLVMMKEYELNTHSLAYRTVLVDLLNKLILLAYIDPHHPLIQEKIAILNQQENHPRILKGLSVKEKIKWISFNILGASLTIQIFSHLFRVPSQYNIIRK